MNRIKFNGPDDVEPCLLKAEGEPPSSGEEIDSDRPVQVQDPSLAPAPVTESQECD